MKHLYSRKLILILTLLLSVGELCAKFKYRNWQNVDGRKVAAEYVSQDDKTVKVRLKSGQLFDLEKIILKQSDIDYLDKIKKEEDAEAEKKFLKAERNKHKFKVPQANNPGFESGKKPWKYYYYGNSTKFYHINGKSVRSGNKSLNFIKNKGIRGCFAQQEVKLKNIPKDAELVVSAWTNKIGKDAERVNADISAIFIDGSSEIITSGRSKWHPSSLINSKNREKDDSLPDTWTKVSFPLKAPKTSWKKVKGIRIYLRVAGDEKDEAEVYFDDVTISLGGEAE